MMELTVQELAGRLGARLIPPDAQGVLTAVGPLDAAGPDRLTFASEDRHHAVARTSPAGAILVRSPIAGVERPQLVVSNVDGALIEAMKLFAPSLTAAPEGIDPTARIAKGVKIGDHASIGPYVVIEEGVRIGQHVIIAAGCRIGQATEVGDSTRLDCNVVIYHHCRIGSHVIIQANTTIGSVGFGYALVDGAPRLIPHNGGVIIEDCVEIGANCCIDRAKFTNTIVGAGTKIDNLVQIGHNVVIGKCCLISAQAGIAGSCQIGDGVVMAGQVGLADNLKIGDRVMIGAQAGVMSNVPANERVAWTPALEQGEVMRVIGEVLRLPKTVKKMKELAKRVERLEAPEDHQG
jgi:UDP-3-O-[3-hydroxymyristoyl] glucosamine N-acyltransferase